MEENLTHLLKVQLAKRAFEADGDLTESQINDYAESVAQSCDFDAENDEWVFRY